MCMEGGQEKCPRARGESPPTSGMTACHAHAVCLFVLSGVSCLRKCTAHACLFRMSQPSSLKTQKGNMPPCHAALWKARTAVKRVRGKGVAAAPVVYARAHRRTVTNVSGVSRQRYVAAARLRRRQVFLAALIRYRRGWGEAPAGVRAKQVALSDRVETCLRMPLMPLSPRSPYVVLQKRPQCRALSA